MSIKWYVIYPDRNVSTWIVEVVKLESETSLTDYTAGRWLRNDDGERKARHISFSFKALVDKVVSCCEGATLIKTWSKKEGNSCKVFVFCTDNDKQLVAKLPTSVAGPKSLVTNSEVATIRYCMLVSTSRSRVASSLISQCKKIPVSRFLVSSTGTMIL
jgi:hypothetical protein